MREEGEWQRRGLPDGMTCSSVAQLRMSALARVESERGWARTFGGSSANQAACTEELCEREGEGGGTKKKGLFFLLARLLICLLSLWFCALGRVWGEVQKKDALLLLAVRCLQSS